MVRSFLCLFILGIVIISSASGQGKLSGKISDTDGIGLFGVIIVALDDYSIIAQSDFDGLFELKCPDTKVHVIKFSLLGYEEFLDTLSFSGNNLIKKEYTLYQTSLMSKEVNIEAKALRSADTYMEKIKMNSTVTIDYISSETIRKTGDANVINAIARISGVSTNGGMITVRGIGDRYVRTTLNGSRIPTLDPLTNNIKLDIFPSSLVDNIIITKTASPEYAGDWSGAYISVETKDFPDQLNINIETQFGYNQQSTFKDFITSERSSTDWMGFDGGLRTRQGNLLSNPNLNPGSYNEMVALGLGEYFNSMGINGWTDGNSNADTYIRLGLVQLGLLPSSLMNDPNAYQQALTEYNTNYKPRAYRIINPNGANYNNGFSNNWNTRFIKAPMSFSQNFSIGNQSNLFGRPLGYFIGFRYGSSYRYDPNGISQRVLDESVNYAIDTQDETLISRETNSWSALFNMAYKLNDRNKFSLMFMPNVIGVNDVASYINMPLDAIDQTLEARKNIFYEQRQQLIYQYKSEHYIPSSKIRIDLNASYTDGKSIAPDFRTSEYKIDLHYDTIVGYQYYPTLGDGIRRFFRYLDENMVDTRVDFELPLTHSDETKERKLKFGLATQRNFRKIDNEEYRVMLGNNNFIEPIQSDDLDAYMSYSRFIMQDSIIDFYYLYNDDNRNHSFGRSNVEAGYVMTNWELTQKMRFSGGARLEHTDIYTDVDKYSRLGYADNDPRRSNVPSFPNVNPALINEWHILPSLSLIYKLEGPRIQRTNLRLNFSKSIARPSIRELNDAAIIDNEYRTFIYGNSDLRIAQIFNYDFRAESFFDNGDNISVSLFYKDFKDHIEMGFGNIGITWENIEKSSVKGLEIEGHKRITRQLDLRANVTLVQSESQFIRKDFQLIEGEKFYAPIDTMYRPMYGQAPYLVNAILSYKADSLGLVATISYNVQGPRLVITGAIKGRPDVYEIERHLLDFKLSKRIGQHFTVSATIRDILNAPVRRAYKLPTGWFDFDNFRFGTNYLLSVAYKY